MKEHVFSVDHVIVFLWWFQSTATIVCIALSIVQTHIVLFIVVYWIWIATCVFMSIKHSVIFHSIINRDLRVICYQIVIVNKYARELNMLFTSLYTSYMYYWNLTNCNWFSIYLTYNKLHKSALYALTYRRNCHYTSENAGKWYFLGIKWVSEYCFTSVYVQSWKYRDKGGRGP